MIRELLLLLFVASIIVSTILDGSRLRKEAILKEMQESYTKSEALNLVYDMKRSAMFLFLAYGVVLGVLITGIIMKR